MAVGPLHIDPSWEKLEETSAPSGAPIATTPVQVAQVNTATPPPVDEAQPQPKAKLTLPLLHPKKLPIWLFGVAGLVVVGGVLVVLSEYGTLSLGIEQFWGLSNRAEQALQVAANTLGGATNYRVTGKVTLNSLLPADGSATADSSLDIEFVQDRASGASKTTGNITFRPVSGQEQLLGPLLSKGVPVGFELVQVGSDAYVHVDTVDEANKWVKFSTSDLNYLGLKTASWPTLVQGMAQSVIKVERLPKQQLENVSTKGYQTQVLANGLMALFSSTALAESDQFDTKSQLGISDKRPYALTLAGPVTTKTLKATLGANFNLSSFGSVQAIVPPTADQVKVQSVPLFLSQHGLLKADSVVGRDVQRKADLHDITIGLIEYAAAQHPFAYPKVDGIIHLDKGTDVAKAIAPYLLPAELPADPLATDRYYAYSSDGKSFTLSAALENTGDPAGKQVGNLLLYSVVSQP